MELKWKEERERAWQKLLKAAVSQSLILDQHNRGFFSNTNLMQVRHEYKTAFSDKLARGCSMEFLLDAEGRMRADLAESLWEYSKLDFCCSCWFSLGAGALFFASEGVRRLKQRENR